MAIAMRVVGLRYTWEIGLNKGDIHEEFQETTRRQRGFGMWQLAEVWESE